MDDVALDRPAAERPTCLEPPTDAADAALRWAEHERSEQVRRARDELRDTYQRRLSEQQIALVAEVMADVRMLSIKLGR